MLNNDESGALLPWQALKVHHQQMKSLHLLRLFTDAPHRGEHFSLDEQGLYLDYSKNLITDKTMELLIDLARAKGLPEKIDDRFASMDMGVESAFNRALQQDGILTRMTGLAGRIWNGEWTGYSGMRIRTVINLNVDENDPGPSLACQSLKGLLRNDLTTLFVARDNHGDFGKLLGELNPAETLFIVVSDTFTCRETIACAHMARRWILKAMRDECAVARHFIAVSDNESEARRFGIEGSNIFDRQGAAPLNQPRRGMLDFPTLLGLGPAIFQRMLAGMRSMDRHFTTAPLHRNLPVVMGLLRVWYGNFYGCNQFAVLPNPGRLPAFPDLINRLIASNGGTMEAIPVRETAGVHLHEQMHQQEVLCQQILHGTAVFPCDFIGFCRNDAIDGNENKLHMARMFALTKSLAFGSHWQELRGGQDTGPLEQCLPVEGNHPSNTLLAEDLTPEILGEILALYGNSIYTQQIVGQWRLGELQGRETEKLEAHAIAQDLEDDAAVSIHDSSTAGLIRHYRTLAGAGPKLYVS